MAIPGASLLNTVLLVILLRDEWSTTSMPANWLGSVGSESPRTSETVLRSTTLSLDWAITMPSNQWCQTACAVFPTTVLVSAPRSSIPKSSAATELPATRLSLAQSAIPTWSELTVPAELVATPLL